VGKSDCGGLSVLFATVLRSQGVPTRTLVGRWANSAKANDKVGEIEYFQEHVKAEFFANGVGWVPVDVSAAVVHDKTPAKLGYFGIDRGDFLTMHFDSDLAVDTLHFGVRTINLLQGVCYWARGAGTFKDAVQRENWEVEVLPQRSFR
jgi:transglutaminase-like putative cysteine protease